MPAVMRRATMSTTAKQPPVAVPGTPVRVQVTSKTKNAQMAAAKGEFPPARDKRERLSCHHCRDEIITGETAPWMCAPCLSLCSTAAASVSSLLATVGELQAENSVLKEQVATLLSDLWSLSRKFEIMSNNFDLLTACSSSSCCEASVPPPLLYIGSTAELQTQAYSETSTQQPHTQSLPQATSVKNSPSRQRTTLANDKSKTKSKSFNRQNTITKRGKNVSAPRVPVQGKRAVWGTLSVTGPNTLTTTISKLTSIPHTSFSVRRKKNNAGVKRRWWYVITASEQTLEKLEKEWEKVNMVTNWSIKPCTKPNESKRPTDNGSDGKSNISSSNSTDQKQRPPTFLEETSTVLAQA